MTDFYAILKNAIAESKADSATLRAALYARARASLNKQLEALKPPLSAAARQEQREALERAVRRIEAEAGARPAAAASPAGTTAQSRRPERVEKKAAAAPPAGKAAAAARPAAAAPAAKGAKAGASETPRRRGRAATLVPLVILLVIVVGGALAYWQWDAIGPRLTGLTGEITTRLGTDAGEPAPEKPATGQAAPDMTAEPPAMGTREEQSQAPMPVAPGEGTDMAAAETQPAERPAEMPAETPAAAPPAERPAEMPAETPAAAPPAEAPAPQQAQTAAEPDKDQSRVPAAAPLPTERAYLLVEQQPAGSPDKRYDGTSLWSVGGSGADTSLAVAVNFPDLSADISLVMRLNTDGSLPASHTIDVAYHGPAEPDGTITQMAGFMVRSDSGDTSVPLKGAGAGVVPGQFLFGLSDEPDARKHNLSQLQSGNWLLIPVQFTSKRRSVILIEKGASGREAMDKAFAAWEKARPPAQSQ